MKTPSFKRFSLFAICLLTVIFSPSCNKDNTDPADLPDGVYNATISGEISQSISVLLPKQNADTTGQATNGSYVSTINTFQILALGPGANWGLTIAANTGGVKTGNFTLTNFGTFYTNSHTSQFVCTGGTLNITKAELYAEVNSMKEYFVDGSFSADLEDTHNPPHTVHVTGTFSGVNIKQNN